VEVPQRRSKVKGRQSAPGDKPGGQLDENNWALEVYHGSDTQKTKEDYEELLEFDLEEEEARSGVDKVRLGTNLEANLMRINWALEVYHESDTQKTKEDYEELLEFYLEEEEAEIAQ
jgi:hypothetical protein